MFITFTTSARERAHPRAEPCGEPSRRAAPPSDDDLLDRLINSTDEEGGPASSDVEVRDQVVSLIVAGYDTTSAGVSWALTFIAR